MGAVARAIDGTVRSSYAPKDSPYTKGVETFARQQANKIPVASQYMQPSVDVWGNERKREGDTVAERVLHNVFNPGNYSSNKRTELDDKLTELYEATGSSTVLPKTAATYIDESEQNPKVYLNSEEYTKFAKTKGQKSQKYVSDFVNSDIYKAMDNDAKVDVVADLYSLANYEARKEALAGHSIDFSTKMYENALESGVEPYEYYATKAVGAAAGMTGEFEDVQEKMDICDKLKMDYSTYSELSKTISDLHDSTDANGKTIKGKSRKDKVYATLKKQRDTGVITDEQMWYVWVDNYNAKTRDKKSSLPYWKDCPYKWIVDAKVAEKEAAAEAKKNRG
jgi:hypothetical protein